MTTTKNEIVNLKTEFLKFKKRKQYHAIMQLVREIFPKQNWDNWDNFTGKYFSNWMQEKKTDKIIVLVNKVQSKWYSTKWNQNLIL